MTEFVKIVEVGPRDGLQNEKTPLTLADRKNLILDLMQTGLSSIEVGSCVIGQMGTANGRQRCAVCQPATKPKHSIQFTDPKLKRF